MNIPELIEWIEGIYQLETTDLVLGGVDGIDNVQARQLASRTQWLKAQIEGLGEGKQDADATLTALAALGITANKFIYTTGVDSFALANLSAYVRGIMGAADQPGLLAAIGAVSAADLTSAINGLISAAPGALDTLDELAQALGDDPNFAATMTTALAGKSGLAVNNVFTKRQSGAYVAVTSTAGSIALDLALSNHYNHTLTENTVLAAPSNVVEGTEFLIEIQQHASAAKTLGYNSFYKFANGIVPAVSATLGAVQTLWCKVDKGGASATCVLMDPRS